jgi:hypothetical protein
LSTLLRPVLVGKDTKMPDYVVLISMLGSLTIIGANGLVIGLVIAAMFMALWENFAASRWECSRRPNRKASAASQELNKSVAEARKVLPLGFPWFVNFWNTGQEAKSMPMSRLCRFAAKLCRVRATLAGNHGAS